MQDDLVLRIKACEDAIINILTMLMLFVSTKRGQAEPLQLSISETFSTLPGGEQAYPPSLSAGRNGSDVVTGSSDLTNEGVPTHA